MKTLKKHFFYNNKPDLWVILLFVIINTIVIINAIYHHPKIGYDATEHLTYVQVLLSRLPGPKDTVEFFSPPLPYILPSLYDGVCKLFQPAEATGYFNGILLSSNCRFNDGKAAQAVNVFLSLGSTFLMLVIANQIQPQNRWAKISALTLLSLLTAYYKTFSQVRGEPYVFFFMLLSVYFINKLLEEKAKNIKTSVFLGISLGCLVLSRQWGFFIFPAMGLLLIWTLFFDLPLGKSLTKAFMISAIISFLVGGWFYLSLYYRYGSFTAFNIGRSHFSSKAEIFDFFRSTRLKNFDLFRAPIRPNYEKEFFPILYSETWGDYWGYFVQIKNNSSFGDAGYKNEKQISGYLGQVNLFSVVPSLILGLGVLFGAYKAIREKRRNTLVSNQFVFLMALLFTSFAGFIWFVLNYFAVTDDTVKATYILHMFIPLIILGAGLLGQIMEKSRWVFLPIMGLLSIVFLHNLPAFITRYNMFYFLK
jgi:hypothetical protein